MDSFLDYDLPLERIAQRPAGIDRPRSSARLLHVQLDTPLGPGAQRTAPSVRLEDRLVNDLPAILRPGDLLILNDTKVVPVRFFIERGSGSEMEVLLLARERADGGGEIWEALARPMKRLRAGDRLALSAALDAEVLGRTEDGNRVRLAISGTRAAGSSLTVTELIERDGSMPIPGYIREGRADESDRDLYQTVFAREPGSVAAPTAGLHFTPELLAALGAAGVAHRFITLHVGPASFQPVRDPSSHQMPSERYSISPDCWAEIAAVRERGGRIVAVGTTTTRALEGAYASRTPGTAPPRCGSTSIFITPGFELNVVDLLMTNFHQPRTSHLLLVAALIGGDATAAAYRHALAGEYRFLSYGDAMLLEGRAKTERSL